jgi:putative nucleotidyltransferase with HDIG domain
VPGGRMKQIRKEVLVDELVEGMILGTSIHDDAGNVLLSEGLQLTPTTIDRIDKLNMNRVPILYEVEELINEEYKEEIDKQSIERTIYETRLIMDKSLKKFQFNELVEFEKLKAVVNQLISEILSRDFVTLNLTKIKNTDAYLLEHSVNVCLLSLITGVYMGYAKAELINLGLGALLHDIGKMFIPDEIINKPSKLTEDEFNIVKNHTTFGGEAAKKIEGLSQESIDIILYHHERIDGKGYPMSAPKEKIPDYARIVSVADVFDAITSDRVYRDRIDAYTAVEFIISESGTKFDKDVVRTFLKLVGYYPIGLRVSLNSGEQGIIKKKNKKKPIVRILLDEHTRPVPGYYEVDLNKNPSVLIDDFKLKGEFK